jgi:aryl-alcohol dehydrogenase-like predicted oxidoreductase
MQYVNLGNTGLKVSRIILGCMSIGEQAPDKGIFSSGWVMKEEESIKALHHAYFDRGVNTFDTSNNYTAGQSERVIGRFLKQFNIPREEIVIMTKCFFNTEALTNGSQVKPNTQGLSRKNIIASVNGSLERLQVEYIDVLFIHRFDTETPVEETMETLNDLVRSGKVRYIAASSMYAWQFAKMQYTAEKNSWTKFIAMQNLWNLLYREEEREMIPLCKDQGVGLVPYAVLAQGAITRPASATVQETSREYINMKYIDPQNESLTTVRKNIEDVAEKLGVSKAQIAIAWLLAKGANPIVGVTNKPEQLDDIVKAMDLKLSNEDIHLLEKDYRAQEQKTWFVGATAPTTSK